MGESSERSQRPPTGGGKDPCEDLYAHQKKKSSPRAQGHDPTEGGGDQIPTKKRGKRPSGTTPRSKRYVLMHTVKVPGQYLKRKKKERKKDERNQKHGGGKESNQQNLHGLGEKKGGEREKGLGMAGGEEGVTQKTNLVGSLRTFDGPEKRWTRPWRSLTTKGENLSTRRRPRGDHQRKVEKDRTLPSLERGTDMIAKRHGTSGFAQEVLHKKDPTEITRLEKKISQNGGASRNASRSRRPEKTPSRNDRGRSC